MPAGRSRPGLVLVTLVAGLVAGLVGGPAAGPAGATTAPPTTTAPTTTAPTPTIATVPVPLTRSEATLCRAYDETVKGSQPVLAFDGSSKDAPLSLLGQARVSGVGVRQAVRAEQAYLADLVQDTAAADRGVLAPYVAAYRQVLGLVRADHDNLTRVNVDRRLPREDGPVVSPPAGVAALVAGVIRVCPVPGRPTRPAPGSHTASG